MTTFAPDTRFALDTRKVGTNGLAGSLRRWQKFLGDRSAPVYEPATMADLRVRFQQVRVDDALIHTHEGFSAVRAGKPSGVDGAVSLILVNRGSATVGTHDIPAGSYLVRRLDRPVSFTNGPCTAGMSLTLPGAAVAPLLGDRVVHGPADSAEMRLLTGYADLLRRTAPDLSPAGARAAREALAELTAGVVRGAADSTDPLTAPALVEAAKNLAESHLTDAGLGPATLAAALHVSVRTLQRAFAGTGESVTSYIRRRRLDRAHRDLTDPAAHLTVSEIAARWQFSDGAHLSRAFRQRYGTTPTDVRPM
ncbi:helix-turn-helix domain-containing protein [Actinoplanes couchii]|uniref:Transcriptional regulator n=1 Tax=Actinoplanes couchii TaxID=403638 RepID=A0ABQ3XNM5_9ACTN|nr:helix-turn-helix domain-containing protein [Actinoplanes couchii]MDR6318084.1 AraC-like DNA-binding protein [Actinoplanes couchii]GID60000.1 transcriptional regulator [Actinoplanes couchii]